MPKETAVRDEDVAEGIEPEEVAKRLRIAMTAPGMESPSGTASWRNIFRDPRRTG